MNNQNKYLSQNITLNGQKYLITEILFHFLLLTPILSYFTFGVYGKESSIYYFQILFTIYTAFLLFYKKFLNIKIPKFLYFLLAYIIYLFFWSLFNGTFEKKGFFVAELREQVAVFFILLLIFNINFSERFIKITIQIIKITVIIAFIVSIIQFFNPSILDASPLYKFKYFEKPTIDLSSPYEFRRLSIFGYTDLNDLGLSFLPLLAILLGYLGSNKRMIYIFYILGLVVAALSNTRYVIIGALFLILILWITSKVSLKGYLKNSIIFALLIMISVFLLQFIGYDIIDWFAVRLFAEKSVTSSTRYGAVENFLIFYPKTPFIGTGTHLTAEIALASASVGSSQIHVGYLSHLISYGLVGSIFLFGFWYLLLRELYLTARKTNYWGSFFAFLIFIWANMSLVMYSIFFYGLIIAFVFNKYFRDNSHKFNISSVNNI